MSQTDFNHDEPLEELPPELRALHCELDRLGATERDAAPARLRSRLVAMGGESSTLRGDVVLSFRRGRLSTALRVAAVIALAASVTAVTWWASGPALNQRAAAPTDGLDLETELALLESESDPAWLAAGSTDLDELEWRVASLDASADGLWLDFDDPLAEESL